VSGVTLSVVVIAAVAAPALALTGSQSLARLQFRHTIEAIRDDGVDAILDGRLRADGPASYYLGSLETMAEQANWDTVAIAVKFLPNMAVEGEGREPSPIFLSMTVEEQNILRGLQARVKAAVRAYLIWGNPVRWLLLRLGEPPVL
jgi:hypothetical protein